MKDSIRWLLPSMLAMTCLACAGRNEAEPPMAEATTHIDKAGVTTTLQFTIEPGRIEPGQRAMIALVYPQSVDASAERYITVNEPAFKVRLAYEGPGVPSVVAFRDRRTLMAENGYVKLPPPAPGPLGTDIVRASLATTDGKKTQVLLGGFDAELPGRYSATVTTVVDAPVFRGVVVKIVADQYYNVGK